MACLVAFNAKKYILVGGNYFDIKPNFLSFGEHPGNNK